MAQARPGVRHGLARRALVVAVASLALCCGTSRQFDPLGEPGDDALLTDAEKMAAAFELVREVLFGSPPVRSRAALDAAPGRRVFVCAYGSRQRKSCATGIGDDLAGSVRVAAATLRDDLAPDTAGSGDGFRIKIDVVTAVEPSRFEGPTHKYLPEEIGLFGLWVERGQRVSWLLPSEFLEQRIYSTSTKPRGVAAARLSEALSRREPHLGELPESFDYTLLRTVAWVERDPATEDPTGIVRLYRVHRHDVAEPTRDDLLQRAVWAADYLISSVSSEGRIRYRYYVTLDREKPSHSLIRHCGTTYSMLQMYDRTKHRPYLVAAQAAMEYVFRKSQWAERQGPYGGGRVFYFIWEGSKHIHLGGAGLALLMINQFVEATGDRKLYLDEARGYARFIVSQQKESGEFVYRASPHPGGEPSARTSAFYPGEAILGLARLYAYDPDPLWRETAVRGADWLIDVRDGGKTPDQLQPDHWLMIALSYLYAQTGDERYARHTRVLSEAMRVRYQINLARAERYPDYAGSYYYPPQSTPAATIGEGLTAMLDTCARVGWDCAEIRRVHLRTVGHEILSQYEPDVMWWPPDPAKTFGGWAGGLENMAIRCDFVQHNLSSILGAERHMAAREGLILPGGPAWTERNLAGEAFGGISSEEMARLRSASFRYRGETIWDRAIQGEAGP